MITWQQMFYATVMVIFILIIVIIIMAVNKKKTSDCPNIFKNIPCNTNSSSEAPTDNKDKSENIYLRLAGTDKVVGIDKNNRIVVDSNIADPINIQLDITSSNSISSNKVARLEIITPCDQLPYGSICIDDKLQNRYINYGNGKTVVQGVQINTTWNFELVTDNIYKISNRIGFWKSDNIYGSPVLLDQEVNASEWEIVQIIKNPPTEGNYYISLNDQDTTYLGMDKYMTAIVKKDEKFLWTLVQQDNLFYFKLGDNVLGYTVNSQNQYRFKFSADNRYPRATFRTMPGPEDNTWYFIFFAPFCPNDQRCRLILSIDNINLSLDSTIYPQIYWKLTST